MTDPAATATDRTVLPFLLGTALLAGALLSPGLLQAQVTGSGGDLGGGAAAADSPDVVERVVAVVADTVILLSEVQQQILRMRSSGMTMPQDPAGRDSLMRSTLQQLIDRMLLVKRAQQQGVEVSRQEVESRAQTVFEQRSNRFSSLQAFRAQVERTGMNMYQYRQMLRSRAREELLIGRFRQQLMTGTELPPASVSEEEIRRFFEQNAGSVTRPATLSFDRIIVTPEPSKAAVDSAHAVAARALEEIQSGTSFKVAARRYSDDPGSRERGGELGWLQRGDVVSSFADAAWTAPPGRPVGPVQTRYGFHIIKVSNTRGGERQIRHILVRPEITEEDVEAARRRAEALADSLRQGEDPDRLAEAYGLQGEQVHFRDVEAGNLRPRFGQAYSQALSSPSSGEVVGPFRQEASFGLTYFIVAKVNEYRPEGSYELADVRDRIRQQLLRRKQLEKYLKQLREEMYVRILL